MPQVERVADQSDVDQRAESKDDLFEWCGHPAYDNERSTSVGSSADVPGKGVALENPHAGPETRVPLPSHCK